MRTLPQAARDKKLPRREEMFVRFAQVQPGDIFLSTVPEYQTWNAKKVTEVEESSHFIEGSKREKHLVVYLRFEGLPALRLCVHCIAETGVALARVEREVGT